MAMWDLSAPRDGVSAILWEINGEITTFPANKQCVSGELSW